MKILENLRSHERVNAVLTALILLATLVNAIATVVYVVFVKQSSETATTQTNQLIKAANIQADAATKNADSAASMALSADKQAGYSKSIAEQTLAQAMATNALARQAARSADTADRGLQSSIELSREDRRAWVGLQGFQCTGCTVDMTDFAIVVSDFAGFVVNTGKTPALRMTLKTTFMNRKRGEPIPEWEAVERESSPTAMQIPPNMPSHMRDSILKTMEIVNRDAIEIEALPPNAVRTFTVPSTKFGRERSTRMEDQVVVYMLGKITYYDTKMDKIHNTWFCLVNNFGDGFHFCPSGNDMD